MKKEEKVIGADSLFRFVKYIIGYNDFTRKTIRSWTIKQRKIAQEYFVAVCADLNDNDVVVPPCPKFISKIIKRKV